MRRRFSSRRRDKDVGELNITAFLNLMVILVPFLLITAVFTKLAILELNLPSASEQTEQEDKLRLEVIVRDTALIVGDGRRRVATIEQTDDDSFDYDRLSEIMQAIKAENPEVTEASVLLEPDTEYDILVNVMDAVRIARQPDPDNPGKSVSTELFPEIALGDAP